ncbi:MAG: ATP-binding cassette domain-containing protein [Nocardioides sp.]|jgi:ABC-2 type transport system ATP-binding protein
MSVRYTRRAPNVLDKLSLEISVGVTGLIGANGAGKSALMRVIAGNLDPIAGQARGQLSLIREPARTGTTA